MLVKRNREFFNQAACKKDRIVFLISRFLQIFIMVSFISLILCDVQHFKVNTFISKILLSALKKLIQKKLFKIKVIDSKSY